MKRLYRKIDKELIPNMPRLKFEGRIYTIQSASEAERAVNALRGEPIVGIDTETRPSFRKGRVNTVALLQVSTYDLCFLFRLNQFGLTPPVRELLEDEKLLKVGLSLHDDKHSLLRRGNFQPRNWLDLQDYVKLLGIEDMSLLKLCANVLGRRISKTARLSNWEADVLTDAQKSYAATDAYVCLLLYDELRRLRRTGEYEVIDTPATSA